MDTVEAFVLEPVNKPLLKIQKQILFFNFRFKQLKFKKDDVIKEILCLISSKSKKKRKMHGISAKMLKTVAFIAGKKNPADQNFYIRFSIEIKLKQCINTDVYNQIFNGKTIIKILVRWIFFTRNICNCL